jgi:phosphotransacetylase
LVRYVQTITNGVGQNLDFPTLGSHANGLYISVQNKASTTNLGYLIQGFKKPGV